MRIGLSVPKPVTPANMVIGEVYACVSERATLASLRMRVQTGGRNTAVICLHDGSFAAPGDNTTMADYVFMPNTRIISE